MNSNFWTGLIYEAEIQAGEDSRFFQQSLDQYFKQVGRFQQVMHHAVPLGTALCGATLRPPEVKSLKVHRSTGQ